MALKRALGLALAGPVCGFAISACGSAGSQGRIADASSRTYSDPAGWAIRVPPRWRVTRFMNKPRGDSAGGRGDLQRTAVDARHWLPSPPLRSPDASGDQWSIGSAPTGSPYLETLEFRVAGKTFVASAKIGAHVSRANLRALASVLTSLR
jgi:hypothetical protein